MKKSVQRRVDRIPARYSPRLKLLAGLLLAVFFQVYGFPAQSYSQDKPIDLRLENAGLEEVLMTIKSKTGMNFFYKTEHSAKVSGMDLDYRNRTVEEILSDVLDGTHLDFEIVNNSIIIKQRTIEKSTPDFSGEKQAQSGQPRVITGTVKDQEGVPMVGVTVMLKGTSKGTITDIDGNYSIEVPDNAETLAFSFVGYITREVKIGKQDVINIRLEESVTSLEDVVVIGYGTAKKTDLTGSVSVVSAEDINNVTVPNLGRALQGKASGVLVMQDGSPEGGINIRVRGIGSISGDPDPLYVIDGIVGADINSVAPEDISSISILKDASSAAIYGANAANGVVLITTKRGSGDGLSVSLSSYFGVNLNPRQLDLMNADEYVDFYSTVYQNNEQEIPAAFSDEFRSFYYGEGWESGTSWQNEILQKSMVRNHHVNISRGDDRSNQSISFRFYDREGTLVNTGSKRYNLRVNSDYSLGKMFRVGESLVLTRKSVREGNDRAWGMALQASPLMKVYNPDNKEGFEGSQITYDFPTGDSDTIKVINTAGNDKFNPRGKAEIPDKVNSTDALLASAYLEFSPFGWLTFTTTPSLHTRVNDMYNWIPAHDMGVRSVYNATLESSISKYNTYSLENKITFDRAFDRHHLNAVFVHHARYGSTLKNGATAVGFPYEQLNIINQSDPEGRSASGTKVDLSWSQLSYLGRVMYNFDSKYLVTASFRRDGTSNFGPENKWGNFPSFSAAWKVNEDFLKNVDEITMLKIRLGWGMTGNSDIGRFRYQTNLTTPNNFQTVFGEDQQREMAMNEWYSVGNPIIKWEAAKMTNVGIDLNMFRNKLQFSAEYYMKKQNDLLFEVPVSGINGKFDDWNTQGTGVWYNIGEIHNTGFEFDLRYAEMSGSFTYEVFSNLSTVTNSVDYIPQTITIGSNITTIGHTIGSLYGYVADRIIQESDFDEDGTYLHAEPSEGEPAPGDLKFKDLNRDGVISDKDRTIIGKGIPDMTYSFGLNTGYRNFDLSLYFYGVENVQVLNALRSNIESFSDQDLDHNKSSRWYQNYYSEDNPSTEFVRLDPNNNNHNDRTSTWWVEDASFLRLKEFQVGYTIPENLTELAGISRFRIYLSGINLITFTRYKGYDPEAPLNTNDPKKTGVDYNTYPVPRSLNAGLQIIF